MPSTTNYKKWEIVLVPFPFTDLSSVKRRPALIVSPDIYNAGKDLVIAYITSQLNSPSRVGDYKLKKWKEAGLLKSSIIKMKFATIDKTIIVKTVSELADVDREEIEKILLSFFKS
ncbi:MAG: type II toxin-antitoxin system PemK/MazF family toxin [Acidobacteria bacterium]|jgi:mRNA interferase MazF|nr:type II toxin-antitoxin system PemK/MazF family toxin [Acidobacteriota bacterium]MBA3784758.1 type II toxin-antitoxin system PemK/MazF family toxin [Acidobacteriota bacterium]MBA4183834.1 type II toxin-antitoxin system PemK/MazF family toxin [Acidobacteriota bacterium]HEV8158330.1 type II toxin-antitoxin system PemK/MazF family toxin [Pyrinomonadaceae bacterium]